MEAGRYRIRLVQGCDAEIHSLRLMIDLHQERRPALAAELAVAEARLFQVANLAFALRPAEVAHRHAREYHCRRSAAQLAGPAMAPSCVEWIAQKLVSNGSAKAPSDPPPHQPPFH